MTPEKPKKFLRLPEIIGPGGRIPVSRSTWYRFYEGERRPRIGYPGFVCSNLGEPR
jgi:hypothetical protein